MHHILSARDRYLTGLRERVDIKEYASSNISITLARYKGLFFKKQQISMEVQLQFNQIKIERFFKMS